MISESIQREETASGSKRPRPWRRLHASTYVVLLLTTAVLFLLNVPGQLVPFVGMPLPEEQLFGDHRIVRERLEHGWPFTYLIRDDRYFVKRPGESEPRPTPIWSFTEDFVSFNGWRLAGDLFAALGMLGVVGLLAEYWRRQRHAIWQLRISDLLGITAIIAGAIWYAQSTWREYEVERSAIEDLGLFVMDYSQFRRDPVSSSVSVRSHGGPSWLRSLLGERFPKMFDRLILLDDVTMESPQRSERIAAFKRLRVIDVVLARQAACPLVCLAQCTQLEAIRIAVDSGGVLQRATELDHHLASSLPALVQLPKLWYFRADGDGVADRAVNVIADFPALRTLSLNGSVVTVKGFEALARCQTLEELDFAAVPISGASLVHLSRLPRLQHLSLYECSVTDADYDQLVQLSELEQLTIHETKAYGEGLYKLAALKNLKYLTLPLHADRKRVKALQLLVPALKIEVGGQPFHADEL